MEKQHRLSVAGLGLAGEAGEVADLIKKHLGHGHDLPMDKLIKELGDAQWYINEVASIFNIPMSKILTKNINKLADRYPDGFSEERSINRDKYGV
nr:nucleoside triphosphate pyrophosphohydrolase family protein [Virgibacillus massiliensis]